MRFLHISDLHKLDDYKGKGGIYTKVLNNMDDPFIQLETLLVKEGFDYDFVILSGDVCEYGELNDYLTVKHKLEELFNCPILVCSGNHDNKDNLIKAFDKKLIDGELFEAHDIKDIRVILFDSSHPDHNDGFISEKTCDLLSAELNRNDNRKVIVVTHHHLLDKQFTMPKAEYPDRLLDILNNDKIITILTGHTHHMYHGNLNNVPYHTSGGLSFIADEKDGKLYFYEKPSALIFEYDNELKYKELIGKENNKKLDIWDLSNNQ